MNNDLKLPGKISIPFKTYGNSVLGAPLIYFPCQKDCQILFIAGIHGEEVDTAFLLSRCLRLFKTSAKHLAFILSANPDGFILSTRGNASGVDLNRNFPTKNWSDSITYSRSILESSRDTEHSSGTAPASEPETIALIQLIKKLNPKTIISIHSPMSCIDAPKNSRLVQKLCDVFYLPWIKDIGYPTKGSLGTWCIENNIECITLELPRLHTELLYERYGNGFTQFLNELWD